MKVVFNAAVNLLFLKPKLLNEVFVLIEIYNIMQNFSIAAFFGCLTDNGFT
jgi:hypothetical protein